MDKLSAIVMALSHIVLAIIYLILDVPATMAMSLKEWLCEEVCLGRQGDKLGQE